jgi:dTDP-4-amino-4,6-dideoxygalactose transaminase
LKSNAEAQNIMSIINKNLKYKLYLSSPHISEKNLEQKFVQEAFDANWIAPLGPNVIGFEEEVKQYTNTNNAVALSSGTAAIHMALKAAGVNKDDIVICQSFTFSATANPIIYESAIPVFIDSDPLTWNIDLTLLRRSLVDYQAKIKAVIIVHLYGLPCPMDEIASLCNEFNVTLIEDAAESMGARYKGQHTGTFGDYGVFSFNGNKIITTSGGGMLVSKYEDRIQKALYWSTQARDQALHYQHSEIGYNYRMSNIVAGIGRGQMTVLDERVSQKKAIFDYYKEHLGDLPGIVFMPVHDWQQPNYWLSCIVTNEATNYLDIIQALEDVHIQSRPLWKPMHLQPVFADYKAYVNGVSERLFNNGLCLPSDTKMTTNDLAEVCSVVRSVWKS